MLRISNCLLYILTSVWVLGMPNAGRNMLFTFFAKNCEKWGKMDKETCFWGLHPNADRRCNVVFESWTLLKRSLVPNIKGRQFNASSKNPLKWSLSQPHHLYLQNPNKNPQKKSFSKESVCYAAFSKNNFAKISNILLPCGEIDETIANPANRLCIFLPIVLNPIWNFFFFFFVFFCRPKMRVSNEF